MTSIFANTDLFERHKVRIQFLDRVMGGAPNNPQIIEGWLRTKMGINDQDEIKRLVNQTLKETGQTIETEGDIPLSVMDEAAKKVAEMKNTNVFYRDGNGLYLPDRYVKAMLKECTNILYAQFRWGETRKGPKSYLAERVFVNPHRLYLKRDGNYITEPDGVALFVGHTSGPKGPQSNLTHYEYVERATVEFELDVTLGAIPDEAWDYLLAQAERIGLGALRSQSDGQFEVQMHEVVSRPGRKVKFPAEPVKKSKKTEDDNDETGTV